MEIVGREREVAVLDDVVASVAAGTGSLVGVVAPSGFGKSRLLDELAPGAVGLLRIGCRPLDLATPLSMAERLSRAFGHEATCVDADELAGVAGPAICVIDDAQWLDDASLALVVGLAHLTTERPLALVVAMRPPGAAAIAAGRLLASIERLGGRTLRLDALDHDDAVRLAELRGPVVDPDALSATAGTPFLVLELADAWQAGRRPSATGVVADTLSRVSPATRAMLEHASILGVEVTVADLAALVGVPVASMVDQVREAIAAGIVVDDGDALRFRHDQLREALYDSIPAAARAGLHGDAARMLQQRDGDVVGVAQHIVASARPGDRAGIDLLRRAADAASSADTAVAIRLLEAAHRLAASGSVDADAIAQRLIMLLAWTGRAVEAQQLASEILPRAASPAEESRLRARFAEALARGGSEAEAAAEAERALALDVPEDRVRASLLLIVATGVWETDPVRCRAIVADARALDVSDDRVEVAAIQLDAVTFKAEMDLVRFAATTAKGVEHARRAVVRRRQLASAHLVWALTNHAEAMLDLEQEAECRHALAEAERTARAAGLLGSYGREILGLRATLHALWCRWDDALAEIEAREEMLAELGQSDASASGISFRTPMLRTLVGVASGRVPVDDELRRWAAVATPPLERARVDAWRCLEAESTDADAQLFAGSVLEAARGLESAAHPTARLLGTNLPWAQPVRVLRAAGRSSDAAALATILRRPARRSATVPRYATVVATLDAILERDIAAAAAALESASAIASPMLRAHATVDAALAAADAGDAELARRHLSDLVDGDVVLPLKALRLAGHESRARPRRPVTGWDALTPSEQRVSELVADGLSNKSIASELEISRYTVETHLKHVFQKLHLSSRVELATLVTHRRASSDQRGR